MPESKELVILFVTEKRNEIVRNYVGVDFYAFPEEGFISIENEQGESSGPMKMTDPPQISQPLFSLNHCHRIQSYAFHRDRVYCIGGHRLTCNTCWPLEEANRVSKAVYCWDAIHNSWISSPETNVDRTNCNLHVLQGKLYVTGYPISKRNGDTVFIERLDESEGRWTVLPCPPPHVKLDLHHCVSAAIESKGIILFGSEACEYFYAYTPPGTWKRMDRLRFDPVILFGQPLYSITVTENHLLWLNGHNGLTIVGFDHNDGHYFEIDLVSEGILSEDGSRFRFPGLTSAGNQAVALVWQSDVCWSKDPAVSVYHCTKFIIYSGNGHLRVKCVSHQTCAGPGSMERLLGTFVRILIYMLAIEALLLYEEAQMVKLARKAYALQTIRILVCMLAIQALLPEAEGNLAYMFVLGCFSA
ncbi:hypothetical protein OROMI_026628 [Orobanche minor]